MSSTAAVPGSQSLPGECPDLGGRQPEQCGEGEGQEEAEGNACMWSGWIFQGLGSGAASFLVEMSH